jgi:hypothetical protein
MSPKLFGATAVGCSGQLIWMNAGQVSGFDQLDFNNVVARSGDLGFA